MAAGMPGGGVHAAAAVVVAVVTVLGAASGWAGRMASIGGHGHGHGHAHCLGLALDMAWDGVCSWAMAWDWVDGQWSCHACCVVLHAMSCRVMSCVVFVWGKYDDDGDDDDDEAYDDDGDNAYDAEGEGDDDANDGNDVKRNSG